MMQIPADLAYHDNQFFVTGNLHFSNIFSIYEKSIKSFNGISNININFSTLTSSDSSGLALIIEWLKLAKKNNLNIQFYSLPKNLMLIAKAAGINEIISSAINASSRVQKNRG